MPYPDNDGLITKINALVSTAPTLSAAADSIGTIGAGTDMVVSNFAGVESVLDKLSDFLTELKSNHAYTPAGVVVPFAGKSGMVPVGWWLCDGSAFPGTISTALQTILVDAGFASTLPDLRGRTVFGVGTNIDVDNVGDSDPISTVANRRPKHQHTASAVNSTTSITASGSVLIPAQTNANAGYSTGLLRFADTNATLGGYNAGVGVTITDPGHGHTINVRPSDYSTVGTPTDTVPYLTLNYIIKN